MLLESYCNGNEIENSRKMLFNATPPDGTGSKCKGGHDSLQ